MKVLITDKVHDVLINGLSSFGEVRYAPMMSYEEVKREVKNYQGLIVNSKVICDRAFLDQAAHLAWIGRLGSGLDIFDLAHAEQLGIRIINSPEGNANAVAEHALGMLLSLMNNIIPSNLDLKEGRWNREPNRGLELHGKTLGIIGLGHTGRAFAQVLKGLGLKIVAHDLFIKSVPDGLEDIKLGSKAEVIKASDILSFHLPLTEMTLGYVDHDLLSQCKKGAIIINTSRGKIADSIALLDALEKGQIYGACLDVLENEKIDTWTAVQSDVYNRLIHHPRVVITPHIAGWTQESLYKIAKVLLDKITQYHLEMASNE